MLRALAMTLPKAKPGAIAVALVHPLLLLLDQKGRFSLLNIVAPFTGPHQRYVYTLGAVAFYGLLVCSR